MHTDGPLTDSSKILNYEERRTASARQLCFLLEQILDGSSELH